MAGSHVTVDMDTLSPSGISLDDIVLHSPCRKPAVSCSLQRALATPVAECSAPAEQDGSAGPCTSSPPLQRPAKDETEHATEEWPCVDCTYLNSAANRACEVCGAGRPAVDRVEVFAGPTPSRCPRSRGAPGSASSVASVVTVGSPCECHHYDNTHQEGKLDDDDEPLEAAACARVNLRRTGWRMPSLSQILQGDSRQFAEGSESEDEAPGADSEVEEDDVIPIHQAVTLPGRCEVMEANVELGLTITNYLQCEGVTPGTASREAGFLFTTDSLLVDVTPPTIQTVDELLQKIRSARLHVQKQLDFQ